MVLRRIVFGMILLAACLLGAALKGGPSVKPVAHFRDFAGMKLAEGVPEGWATWSPRAEIAPRFSVDPSSGRDGKGALMISADGNAAAFGVWRARIDGITAGKTYKFIAYYRAEGVPYERRSIAARLDWLDGKGERCNPPDYVLEAGKEGEWTKVEHTAPAPEGAVSVTVELSLAWSPGGKVWWDDIRLEEDPAPAHRVVRVAAVFHRPRETKSAAESVAEFCRLIERSAEQKPDIVCLPEGITMVGNGLPFSQIAEPIPGPTTGTLSGLAKKLNSYIAAGIYEREGKVIYNTAVLIGRKGEIAGKYRKTHLPREEVEGGLTPGDSYPVFQTDFGKVGLMICWDVQFPEPARAIALKGAEILLLPIWGGSEILARARAIENHAFLVSSSYDMKTFIVDPTGEILAEASAERPVAFADLHLDRKIVQPWLGDMKTRTWKERRPDLKPE